MSSLSPTAPLLAGAAVPLPGTAPSELVIPPPGRGPGYWAGAPSALVDEDGVTLAFRLRRPVGEGRGYAVVVAHSLDGVEFRTLTVLHQEDFDTDSLERPALVRLPDGRWRIYVSIATRGTFHWRIAAIDADTPAQFTVDDLVTVIPGDRANAYKDPVVERTADGWRMWVCRHVIEPAETADAMTTVLATSDDGLDWKLGPTVLSGRPLHWDARGARVAAVLPGSDPCLAFYDGRASRVENWEEQTGLAVLTDAGVLESRSDVPAASSADGRGLRYLSVVPWGQGYRSYYEVTQDDGSHALRTEYAPRPDAPSQSE